MEPLYSGDAMTKASLASRRRRNASGPGGRPLVFCTFWLQDGPSKSGIAATSTVPEFFSITRAARPASPVFSDSARSDAENTRKRTGPRCAFEADDTPGRDSITGFSISRFLLMCLHKPQLTSSTQPR